MNESFGNLLTSWKLQKTDRQKLQSAYVTAALLLVAAAGIISLLDPGVGRFILSIAALTAGVFLINAASWAVIDTMLLKKSSKVTTSQPAVRSRK